MSEQLKQQTLYNVSEANTKNLIWVDVYVSGTEGSAGTYASRRMTKAQLITFLNSNLSVAWSTIASKPTTVAGFGITDAVDTLGLTADYLPKASDSNTLTDSIIRDNGTVGVNVAPNTLYRAYVKETLGKVAFRVEQSSNGINTGLVAGSFRNDSTNTDINYSITAYSSGSTSTNAGALLEGISTGSARAIGARLTATGGLLPRAIELYDGTEGVGKFLKCIDADGGGNWASLAISDVTSLQTSLDAKAPLNPRVQTVASSATVTPVSTNDIVTITAQAVGLTLSNPTGTFVEGQALMIRIKDNGTARTIAFGTSYRAIGVTLPTTTVISKTLYLGVIYNSTDAKFDIVGLNQEA